MKRKKVDLGIERQILMGMITNDTYLKEIQEIYKPELIEAPFVRLVAGWCLEYLSAYGKAPGLHIQDIYNSQLRKGAVGEDMLETAGEFLARLSEEFDSLGSVNTDYLLDRTEQRFQHRSLTLLIEDLKVELSEGDLQEAELKLLNYNKPERVGPQGLNPFTDRKGIKDAFTKQSEPLFELSGELGRFLGPFERDSFCSFMGPEKRGKTWWLLECAMAALKARRSVAYFQCGDLSKEQVYLRIHTYHTKRHYKRKYCGKIWVPTYDCHWNQTGECEKQERSCRVPLVDGDEPLPLPDHAPRRYKPCDFCRRDDPKSWRGAVWYKTREPIEPLTWKEAYKEGKSLFRKWGGNIRISVHPNNTISIDGMRKQLDIWEHKEGFIPEVIISDYMDIKAPIDGKKDFRHQQNETWQEGRGMSLERHCAYISATQADAKSYEAESVKERHFSEDKRKYGHVNMGMITLNQTADEKKRGIMRIGRMFVREDDFDVREKVTVLQCLAMGRPNLGSFR